MRLRPLSVLVPLGSIGLSLVAIAACEDDGSGGGPTVDLNTPGLDASAADARVVVDAGPDAGPLPVTVTVVTRSSQPIVGATVVFGGAAGDVLGTVTTNAAGIASQLVPAGSQVTVVLGDATAPRLLTVTALEPGDAIVALDIPRGYYETGKTPLVDVPTVPAGGPDTGVSYYVVRAGVCSGGFTIPPNGVLGTTVPPRCVLGFGKTPVVLEADDGTGVTLGYATVKGVTLPNDGGTVSPTFGPWSTTFTNQTVSVSNVPDAGNFNVAYAEVADGVLFGDRRYVAPPSDGGTSLSEPFRARSGFADNAQTEASNTVSVSSTVSINGIAVRGPATTTDSTTTLDFGNALPSISAASLDGGAPARPFASWTASGSLASADGTYVVVKWSQPSDAGYTSSSWTFVVPPSVTSVQAPTLPATVLAVPAVDAIFEPVVRVITIDASFVNGYADLRKTAAGFLPTDSLLDNGGGPFTPPLPKDGTVKFSAITVNGD